MKTDYNIELRKRFVNDYKLPFNIVEDDNLFKYYLELFEADFNTLSLYQKVLKEIENDFNGDVEMFVINYYNVREKIIQTILNQPSYVTFNNMSMSKYVIKDPLNITANSVYNCSNVNKIFISIDIKKANFQAIKYVDSSIVYNANTYEDFIKYFTNSNYIVNSKYFRNVVFGKLNPKRHITIEKYIINEVRKTFEKYLNQDLIKIVSLSNDEVIYECQNETIISSLDITSLIDMIKEETGVNVSIEIYKLKGYNLYSEYNKKVNKKFFVKEHFLSPYKSEMKCVPEPFYPIIYKLYRMLPINDNDRRIIYEGMNAFLTDDFQIKEI